MDGRSVRNRRVRTGGEIWVAFHDYLLTNRKCSGGFWPIRNTYLLTSCFGDVWSSGARTSLANSRHGNLNFRRVIYFRFLSDFCFRYDPYIQDSGGTIYGLDPRVRDLRTIEVDSTRLTSLEHVTMGVGSVSRAARIEADSHGRPLRPRYLTMWFP